MYSIEVKNDLLALKMDEGYLPHEIYTITGSKIVAAGGRTKKDEELCGRTREP